MKTANPELSIIIISYNTSQITQNCLQSIIDSQPLIKFEIIVVDNASSDDSVKVIKSLQEKYFQIKLIENKENKGFSIANNQGTSYAQGEYLLFLNSDIIVIDKAIDKLFQFFVEKETQVHFVGGKLLNQDYSPQSSCGPFYSLPIVFAALFLKGDYWGLTRYSPNVVREIDWVSGACILTQKKYFEKVGGFDEKIFMYMDEIDLLYRAKKLGLKVFFYPLAQFIHLGSASSGNRTYPILQVYKGFLYFYKKHHQLIFVFLLKVMLQLKSLIAIIIGKLTNNNYLVSTYAEAYKLVKMA